MGGKGKTILKIVLIVVLAAGIAWLAVLGVQAVGSKQEYKEAKQLTEGEKADETIKEETAETAKPVVTPKPTPKPTDITYTDPVIDELLKLLHILNIMMGYIVGLFCIQKRYYFILCVGASD